MKTYIFKTSLQEYKFTIGVKGVFRVIEVPESISLYKLAEAIIDAYNFDFDHCFGFFKGNDIFKRDEREGYELFADLKDEGIEPVKTGSVKKTKINQVWKVKGDKMTFMFDYGDDWRWEVKLQGFGEKDPKKKYPLILEKQGRAPSQY